MSKSKLVSSLVLLAALSSSASALAAPKQDEPRGAQGSEPAAPKDPAQDPAPVPAEPPKPAPEPKAPDQVSPPVRPSSPRPANLEGPPAGAEPTVAAKGFTLTPYAVLVAGFKYDNVIRRGETAEQPADERQDRISTFAMSRFGLLGTYGEHLAVQSELMASGGIGLHGTSTYEGQAALQVRQQVIRVTADRFVLEGGRVLDEASADYVSNHVQDTLFQDTATRDPLLYSGYNLGNGIRATARIVEGLRIGFAFNAGNPVSNTATLMIGGTFPPFERLFTQAYQAVNQGPNHFPDDTFHSMIFTPSVLFDSKYVDAKVALQAFTVDTNTTSTKNDPVRGYNARGTVRAKLLDGMIVPYLNAATTRNDTVVPTAVSTRSKDRYQAIVLGGGLDLNLARRHACKHDCADGIGLQFEQVQFQVGDGVVTSLRYANVGATIWALPYLAVGARFAWWQQTQKGIDDTGERTVTLGLRAVLQ